MHFLLNCQVKCHKPSLIIKSTLFQVVAWHHMTCCVVAVTFTRGTITGQSRHKHLCFAQRMFDNLLYMSAIICSAAFILSGIYPLCNCIRICAGKKSDKKLCWLCGLNSHSILTYRWLSPTPRYLECIYLERRNHNIALSHRYYVAFQLTQINCIGAMVTSSNGNIFCVTGPLCAEFTGHRWINSPHKGQWCEAFAISLICVWPNVWVNNRNAGNLRRHRAHYDVTMTMKSSDA